MKKTINLTLELSLKDINQTLALLGQDLITSDEELKNYENLTFSTEDMDDGEGKIGMCALLFAAKIKKDSENKTPES